MNGTVDQDGILLAYDLLDGSGANFALSLFDPLQIAKVRERCWP